MLMAWHTKTSGVIADNIDFLRNEWNASASAFIAPTWTWILMDLYLIPGKCLLYYVERLHMNGTWMRGDKFPGDLLPLLFVGNSSSVGSWPQIPIHGLRFNARLWSKEHDSKPGAVLQLFALSLCCCVFLMLNIL